MDLVWKKDGIVVSVNQPVFSLSTMQQRISTKAATPAPTDFVCYESYPGVILSEVFAFPDYLYILTIVSAVRIKKQIISIEDMFFNLRAS